MPENAKASRAGFVPSPICEPVAGAGVEAAFAAVAPDESLTPRDHDPGAWNDDASEGPLFPRFEAALRAPGGPLGPARARRAPKPSIGAQTPLAAVAANRPRLFLSRRALSYLAIVVAGALTGVLLGSQLSSVALGPDRLATDAGSGQAVAVTVPSRSRVGPSSTADTRERQAPVVPARAPRATADALLASTAGTKGDAPRWRPEVAMRSGQPPTELPGVSAGSGDRIFAIVRAPEPTGAIAASAGYEIEEADRALGRAFYQLAYSQQRHGAAEAAMASYSRAGALNPDHAGIWYNWGLLLQQRGAIDDAIGKYVRAIRADRSHRYAWYNLGWLLQSNGEVESAVRVYERAIAVGAAHALTFYNLGWLQQTGGQRELAAQYYREAIALDPAHALARYNLGYLLQLKGDYQGAAEQYRAVLEIEPSHALARRSLTEIDALLGRQLTAHRR